MAARVGLDVWGGDRYDRLASLDPRATAIIDPSVVAHPLHLSPRSIRNSFRRGSIGSTGSSLDVPVRIWNAIMQPWCHSVQRC